MSLSAEVRDLKKCLPALNKLQKDYIKLVEDENEECVVKLTSYTELIDELKKHVKKESMKYSRMIITNPHFTQALEIENGKKTFVYPYPFDDIVLFSKIRTGPRSIFIHSQFTQNICLIVTPSNELNCFFNYI